MEQLGPFAILATTLKGHNFEVCNSEDGSGCKHFNLDLGNFKSGNTGAFAKMLQKENITIKGDLSPEAPITLSSEVRTAISIPESAETFAWAYPCVDEFNVGDVFGVEKIDKNLSFMVFGGYVYFDDLGEIVAANTIAPEVNGGLRFDGQHKFNPDFIQPLLDANRFRPITISTLKNLGAKYFCWLVPNETLTNAGLIRTFEPHGTFVYLFHELDYWTVEEGQNDIFFSVCGEDSTEDESKRAVPDAPSSPTYFPPVKPEEKPKTWACLCLDNNPATMFRCVTCLTWKCENCEAVNQQENYDCKKCLTRRSGPLKGVEIEERWENERWYPFIGWSKPHLPTDPYHFSDGKGREILADEEMLKKFGEGWKWKGEWEPDLSGVDSFETDEDGWMYSRTYVFSKVGDQMEPRNFRGAAFRKRKQVRTRFQAPDVEY